MKSLRALVGLEGTRLRADEREVLVREGIPGVLLLRHNVRSSEQLRELCAQVQDAVREATGHPAILAVDEEGGAVSPLAPALGPSVSARSLGQVDEVDYTNRVHRARAVRCRELGVGMVLAPVADIDRIGNPVIATRAFGTTVDGVTRHLLAAMRGLRDGGVRHCVKHWPGHGAVSIDSHESLPTLEVDAEEWKAVDCRPFRAAVEAQADALMVAHLRAPFLDPKAGPTSASEVVVRQWLRQRWRFEGAILSDALEMGGFAGSAPVAALDAGCDLLLLATPVGRLRPEILEALAAPREDDALAADRIRRLQPPSPTSAEGPSASELGEFLASAVGGWWSRMGWGGSARSWILVDAASLDRLVRPPRGFDLVGEAVASSGGGRNPLQTEFEEAWAVPPRCSFCLESAAEVPSVEAAELDPLDRIVVASVRPLGPQLRAWLLRLLNEFPNCEIAGLGAAAADLDQEGEIGRWLHARGRSAVFCADLHAAARRAVAGRTPPEGSVDIDQGRC